MTTNAPHTGDLIREKREALGWSRDVAANKAGITTGGLYRIERTGRVNVQVLRQIVSALGCEIGDVWPKVSKHAKPTRKASR